MVMGKAGDGRYAGLRAYQDLATPTACARAEPWVTWAERVWIDINLLKRHPFDHRIEGVKSLPQQGLDVR
jgi:hypothetical protein